MGEHKQTENALVNNSLSWEKPNTTLSSIIKSKLTTRKIKTRLALVVYMTPALILLFIFRFWSIFFGFYMSLWKWSFVPEKFLWLDNYIRIFTREIIYFDPEEGLRIGEIGQSLLVTVYYAVISIPLSISISFLLAFVLFQNIPSKALLRTIFFLPYITSQVAAVLVFKWIFHPNVGIANQLLTFLHLPRQDWLTDPEPLLIKLLNILHLTWPDFLPKELSGPTLALTVIILFSIWSSLGFNIVIFLAGMSAIPKDLYESAKVDGANTWQLMRYVTIPMVSPQTFLLTIISVIGAFESFNVFYVFSNGEGGPLGSTMSFPLYIFRNFYVNGQVGYAAATAMFLFVLILILTAIQFRIGEKKVFYQK